MTQSLQRLPSPAPVTLIRIVYERFPLATGVYPLVHVDDLKVFWLTPNGLRYSGVINAIIEDDDYTTYHVYEVKEVSPLILMQF